jgi:hypothetical protein
VRPSHASAASFVANVDMDMNGGRGEMAATYPFLAADALVALTWRVCTNPYVV